MKFLDDRQSLNRSILQQLFPWVGSQTLDILMGSIDSEITPPLTVTATASPSLTIDIGPAIVSNSESNRNHSMFFINNLLPAFTSGTVTFPSTSGGNITTSTGGSVILTLPSGDFVQVLLALDSTGHIITTVGAPNSVEASLVVPVPISLTLPFAYVTLFNNAGTIQNVTQSNIYQFSSPEASTNGSSSPLGVITKTSNYTANWTDGVILCNGTFTVTLPPSAGNAGFLLRIANIGTGIITLAANAGDNIIGEPSQTLYTQMESVDLIPDGVNSTYVF